MAQHYDFDLFTIGAGSGGVASSRRAGSYGARVAICEESRVGGTCVIRGCVPKKLLVYGAQFADAFPDAAGYGRPLGAPGRRPPAPAYVTAASSAARAMPTQPAATDIRPLASADMATEKPLPSGASIAEAGTR